MSTPNPMFNGPLGSLRALTYDASCGFRGQIRDFFFATAADPLEDKGEIGTQV